jgi:outer membrane protein OmpA-like peptidoglycan-associated protein
MMRRLTVVCTALTVATTAAHAQQKGVFEVGVFADVAYFDNSLRLDQPQAGPGARLGYFFTDHLAVEGEGAWVPASGPNDIDVDYIPLRVGLTYNAGGSKGLGALIGAGYTHTMYKTDPDDVSDDGPYGKIGFRLGTGDVVSIRVDTYADWIPSPANDVPEGHAGYNLNWGIEAGLAFMPGYHGAANRDSDKDGVVDGADQCKDTPAGDKVDAKGCTLKDSDGDGVLDDTDACADTPAGDKVDAKGCSLPKDADKDGVLDDKDQCKDTPAGDKVDEKGCSLPKDADGDGVTDDQDACANTPAGEKVNEKGCPLDTDADGVIDSADRCPSTPRGTAVDAEGCQVLFQPTKKTLILEGVNFETGKATLTPESETILNGVAESLVANDSIKVQVAGHTDNTGSSAVNARLSKQRAESVRQFLVAHGVAEDRLTAKGFGPSKPIASNKTAEGRAQNRRVELTRTN